MKKWSLGNNDDGNPDDPPEIQQVHKDQEQESVPQGIAEKSGTKKQKRFHQSVPCNQCGKTFFNTDTLKRHVKDLHRQTSDGLMKCDQCDYACKNSNNMKYHVQAIHEGKVWPCKLCDFEARHKGTLIAHIKSKHEGMEYEFPTGKRVVKKDNKQCPKKYNCEKCDYKTGNTSFLKDHIKSIHDGEPYKCEKCPRTFNFVGDLNAHYREIHDRVTFRCKKHNCRKVFALEQLLQIHEYEKHIKVFKKEKRTQYLNANQNHSDNKDLKVDKETNIDIKAKNETDIDIKVENETGIDIERETVVLKYPCHICEYEFCDQSSLKKHLVLHLCLYKN